MALIMWWGAKNFLLLTRKGYPQVMASGILFATSLGPIIVVSSLSLFLIDTSSWPNWAENTLVISVIFGPPIVALPLTVFLLPAREHGAVRSKSVAFWGSQASRWLENTSWWVGGLVGVYAVVVVFYDAGLSLRLGQICATLIGSASFIKYLRKRAQSLSLDEVTAEDVRAPVLYLRAFSQEVIPFAWVEGKRMAAYSDRPDVYSFGFPRGVTLEQYLGAELNRQVGPLVALGNPEDALPPEGAARAYATGSTWRDVFFSLARSSAVILMGVGSSENVLFELATIRTSGWAPKLFILTAPQPEKHIRVRLANAVLTSARNVRVASWDEFSQLLRRAGFVVDCSDPGRGAVVTFDSAGRTRVVLRDAVEPADFVGAIRRGVARS